MTRRTTLIIPALICLLAAGTACSKPIPTNAKPEGKTAAMCLNDGEAMLKRGKWEDGRKMLRTVEDYFPSSPEFPKAKILIADSFFFGSSSTYPEAIVEYNSFLNYFPRHELREYALYRIGLCHFASIENAERDQLETRKALEAFETLVRESPGSIYVVDARAKITQCWRRLAEAELMVGIFYVNNMSYNASERRLKDLLEIYPEYVDRERAYYYLGEALRNKRVAWDILQAFEKEYLAKVHVEDASKMTKPQVEEYKVAMTKFIEGETTKYRLEARSYYQKLVESYPKSAWAGRAQDRLLEMGESYLREELDI
jgi:outer membrane protein assembly factor BamD